MVMAILFVGSIFWVLELLVLHTFPRFRRWVANTGKLPLFFSFALSFVVMVAFPAAGLIILGATVLSSVAIQPVYAGIRVWLRSKERYENQERHGPINTTRRVLVRSSKVVRWIIHPVFDFTKK